MDRSPFAPPNAGDRSAADRSAADRSAADRFAAEGTERTDRTVVLGNRTVSLNEHPMEQVVYQVKQFIVGQDRLLERLVVALLARGHVLVEGVPGLAKTMAVKTLAQAIGGEFQRIQFTPDLVPADIVGTRIFNQKLGEFQVSLGPVFANLVLADEINRAPAKVQSALLEAMQERQVTIGRETHRLPDPFLVMATQNPIESEGTYPLPEAQVDRFMLKVLVGYPTPTEEFVIVERMMTALEHIDAVIDPTRLLALQQAAAAVYVDPALIEHAVRLTAATRDLGTVGLGALRRAVTYGASPRASINLVLAARALAFVRGRDYALPEDLPEVSADGLTYTFTIRKGLKFSNGADVTPADVKDTFERSLDPGAGFDALISTSYYASIDGYDTFTAVDDNGKPLASNTKDLPGITTDGDKVVFKLSKPDPGFLYAVALRFMNIVPKGSPRKHTDLPPPQTGPYMVTAHTPNRSVKIVRNPQWDANKAVMGVDDSKLFNMDGIDITIGTSQEQEFLQLKNNQIDFTVDGQGVSGGPQIQEALNSPDLKDRFFVNADSSTRWVWLNVAVPPFDNVALRQAVNYAIDRTSILKIAGGQTAGDPWSQILSKPLMKDYVADPNVYPVSPDQDKAKELVKQSGVATPIKISLAFNNSSPIAGQTYGAIKNQLDAVGFDVTLKPLDPSVYYQTIQDKKSTINAGFGGWTQDYSDGFSFFGPLLDKNSSSNYGKFKDDELQSSIDQIAAMPSGPDREKAWAELSDSTERDKAPWAVYGNRNFYELVSARYGGYAWAPTKQRYYALAYVKG